MNQYLTQFEIENMDDHKLLKSYRELFNLIALKEAEIDKLYTLYRTLNKIQFEIYKRR